MMHQLLVNLVWYFSDAIHSSLNHPFRLELREISQHTAWTVEWNSQQQLVGPLETLDAHAYLGLANNRSLININCAQMQSTFRCGPYANKKSHSCSTSGSGGVQAHIVNTLANA